MPPGGSSAPERTVPGSELAWAVLQAGDGGFTAVRSTAPLTLETRGDTLHIGVTAASVVGICGQGGALSIEDALVAQRLFPAELAFGTYDPSSCTFR